MSEVTMQEFKDLCAEIVKKNEEKELLEAQAKELSKPLESLKFTAVEYMKDLAIDAIEVEGHKFTTKFRVYPKIMDKNSLKNYLKSTGQWDDLATLNAATFKKFYEAEKEIAIEQGNVDWSIPGTEITSSTTTLAFKRVK